MVFSSIRVSSLAIHRYLSPGLWKYRLKSTEKSWYFSVSNPAQKWNWSFHFCLPSPRRNLPVSCSARFYDGFEKSTASLSATPLWLKYTCQWLISFVSMVRERAKETILSPDFWWALQGAGGCSEVSGDRNGNTDSISEPIRRRENIRIFLTSKGCAPVNKEKAACTSPANQVGRNRISFRSLENT